MMGWQGFRLALAVVLTLLVAGTSFADGQTGGWRQEATATNGVPEPRGARDATSRVQPAGFLDASQGRTGPFSFPVSASQVVPLTVAFENTGSTTWTAAAGYTMRFVEGGFSFPLVGCDNLTPGDTCAWSVALSNSAPGTQVGTFRMYHGNTAFGGTVTLTLTVAPRPAVGGRGLMLTRATGGLLLTWAPGNTQTGYLVLRWSPTSGFAFLPSPTSFLAGGATSYMDPAPLVDEAYCYVLLPLGGAPASISQVLGLSDLLCIYPSSAQGAPLSTFSLRLQAGNTAVLNWFGPSGTDNAIVTASTFNGAGPRTRQLIWPNHDVTDDTLGLSTCYQIQARANTTVAGTSHKM